MGSTIGGEDTGCGWPSGRQRGRAALERTYDVDLGRARLLPGKADADEQDDEADHAVKGILQFEKGRSEAQKREHPKRYEGVHSWLCNTPGSCTAGSRRGVVCIGVIISGTWIGGCRLHLRRFAGSVLAHLRKVDRNGGH